MDKKVEDEMGAGFMGHMGGCQNYSPFLGTLHIIYRIIIGIQQGTIILTTTLMSHSLNS